MQERSYTLPMCSVGHTSHLPSSVTNVSIDTHSSSTITLNNIETEIDSSTSTPELNLLLDKLTEILRFHSGCRRHFGLLQQPQQQPSPQPTTNLKRLQASSIEPLHNTADVPSMTLNDSLTSTGAWKSSNIHHKSSISNRSSHHHHHHHHKHHINLSSNINNFEKKRRLPGLLQRLIDEGSLIKEAVRRLKTQRFSHTFKQQQQNSIDTPSTPTTKSSIQNSRLTPSSSININLPQQLNDSPTQTTSSPNRGISWFLSSSVFGVNASSPYDRTPMEIGIHDG